MANYQNAIAGLQQVLEAIPRLGLEPQVQAQVAHLIGQAAFNTSEASCEAQQILEYNPVEYVRLSGGLLEQILKYDLLARMIDPSESYMNILPEK